MLLFSHNRTINLLILIILLNTKYQFGYCSTAMKRLYEDLFTDYNRLILPIANNKTKVTVTLGLKLGQILDLNLKQQILSTNVWVEQTWHDYKLEWQPELYEGINMIHVPAENIWIPDIVLFNNADGNYELTLVAKATLYSNGTVVWKPPTMFRSTCEIDVEYFPFDIQTCFLRFGSWTYAGDELELRHVGNRTKVDIGIDLSQFYKNVEWDIIDVPAYYNEFYYDCCAEPFPDITFKIVIRRKMLFYLVNLILPVALMTFMTVSVFYLPSDSNEKVTLSISILTSLIVFFLLMLEIIPASSLAVPLFGKYLLFTLVLVSLSACVSVYVLNIHHRSPSVHSMSPKARQLFLKTLPRLLRLDRPDPRERSSLNRFRKKKIAQQMLNSTNKVYDLAQPLAASLNLIDTLNKSYNFNQKDDDVQSTNKKDKKNSILLDDTNDEGRYFRRYVDDFIENLQKISESKQANDGQQPMNGLMGHCGCKQQQYRTNSMRNCCEHNKCCSRANQYLPGKLAHYHRLASTCLNVDGSATLDLTESDPRCPLVPGTGNMASNNANQQKEASKFEQQKWNNFGLESASHVGILHDDTLDMTFDYEDQQDSSRAANGAHCNTFPKSVGDELPLPSPPPPPRPLANLNGSLDGVELNGRLSSCSKRSMNSSVEESGKLVNNLLSSINLMNLHEVDSSSNTATSIMSTPLTTGQLGGRHAANSFCMAETPRGIDVDGAISQGRRICKRPPMQHQPAVGGLSPLVLGGASGSSCTCKGSIQARPLEDTQQQQQPRKQTDSARQIIRDELAGTKLRQPSDLLLSLRLPYDKMPAHVRAAIRSILFIADTIKNEDDENSAVEDWESMSMVVDRLFLWIFFLLCTFGSLIILALAPSLYDQRASIDDKLRIDIPLSNCSASVYAHS